jgi:hypothetical protein
MKKKILFALSLAAGVVLMSLAADPAGGKKSDDGDTLRELRTQLTELRAEVNQLHQRTETLESSVEELKRSRIPTPLNLQPGSAVPSPSTIVPSPNSTRPPTVWGQGEVNGWTYYIVPCEQQSH